MAPKGKAKAKSSSSKVCKHITKAQQAKTKKVDTQTHDVDSASTSTAKWSWLC